MDAKGRRGIKSQTPHSLLQRHNFLLAHPIAEQLCAVTHFRVKLYVSSSIGKSHDGVRTSEKLTHRITVGVSVAESKTCVQFFFHHQLNKKIKRISTLRFSNLGNVFPF